MLWFFRKQNARVQYEIRRQSDGDEFELVITREDGRQQIETFPDARGVVVRSQLLHDSLIATGWRPPEAAGVRPSIAPSRIVLGRPPAADSSAHETEI